MLSSGSGWDFGRALLALAEAGYSLWWQVLNAKDFGVPQNRERIFVVGTRNGSPREILFEGRDGKEATGGIETLNPQVHQDYRVYDPKGVSPALAANRGGGSAAHPQVATINHGKAVLRDDDVAMNLDASYHKGHDQHGARTMLVDREVARTIRGGGVGSPYDSKQAWDSHIVNGRIRRLTPTECERLMSWPDDWTKFGDYGDGPKEISDTQRYKMCGNGVVSDVVAEIVRAHLL